MRDFIDVTGKNEDEAIAKALGMDLIVWSIKSTTKAVDGLYQYDVVRRLYDSELGNEGVEDIKRYIKMGKLGEAFASDEQIHITLPGDIKAMVVFTQIRPLHAIQFFSANGANVMHVHPSTAYHTLFF